VRVLERIAILAPAIVLGVGLMAGVLILLGRAAGQSLRAHPHPRWLVAFGVAAFALVLTLGLLGLELPHE
jgi:hypothetical protein